MRRMIILLLLLAMCLLSACDESGLVGKPPVPPQEPAPPQPPVRESSGRSVTPEPAATARPADTPVSVSTPLTVLPSYTPEPSPTSSPVPTATPFTSEDAIAQRDENVARCKHWAMQDFEPIEFSRFEKLDPLTMVDLDRILWGEMIANPWNRFEIFKVRSGETEGCMD